MLRKFILAIVVCGPAFTACAAQTPQVPGAVMGAWNALANPAMDPAKTAHVENMEIVRDRVKLVLKDGTIQFTQPVNGIVFGASFRGTGTIQVDPPNEIEAQQLNFFAKQSKLSMAFSEATFSSTDGFYDEIAKQVKWQASGAANDDLYAKRQKEREELGGANLPRLFKGVMSADHKPTAYFLADLKTQEKGWIEISQDALQLEDILIARWSDWGRGKGLDVWMNFPSGGRDSRTAYADPAARLDFLIPSYQISATLADNADLGSTAKLAVNPKHDGERILLFAQDENLRVNTVKDSQGHALEFVQSREGKDRQQSYGNYVAVALPDVTQAGHNFSLEFQSSGKRATQLLTNWLK